MFIEKKILHEIESCRCVSIGVCTCNAPFRGPDCSIDSGKPPTIVKTELNCNGFCQNVVLTGEGFFPTDTMQCQFTKIEVSGAAMNLVVLVYWQFISSFIFPLVKK